MKRHWLCVAVLLGVSMLAGISCRQSLAKTTVIDVPQMNSELDVRIVTNAALDEVVAQYDGIKSEYEVDITNKKIIYHESSRLLSSNYHRVIEARIREVGYTAKVVSAGFNPSPEIRIEDKVARLWPNRYTAVIKVSDMKTNKDANIIVDAIAYARLGKDYSNVAVDRKSRKLHAVFEGLNISSKNLEHAIVSVGFDANAVPACNGRKDAVPHGWQAVMEK